MAIKEVSKRNAETLEQVIQDMRNQIYDYKKVVDSLQTTTSMLSHRVMLLEQSLAASKARAFGTGPSVKE